MKVRRPSSVFLAAILVWGLAGCDSFTGPDFPGVLRSELFEAGPLVRVLEVELAEPSPLVVRYGSDDGMPLENASPSARLHRIPLVRLRAERSYTYRVPGTAIEGSFETGSLPGDLAGLSFRTTGTSGLPLALLHLFTPDGFRGYAVVDGAGEVVWYWRTEGFPYGATRRDNGDFVFMDAERGLLQVTPGLEVVHELPQDTVTRELHHDVVRSGDGTVLFLAFDTREHEGRRLKGEAVWEWFPEEDRAVRRWSSWDHLSPDDDRGPRFGVEWMHANSLWVGPRGNVVVSVHYLNQVLSIAPEWDRLEWRLGGVNATAHPPDVDRFSGQHTAAELSPGRVLLFDNRAEQGGGSRAVEFELEGDEARRVWDWSPPRANFAAAVSSVRRLSGGRSLVAFGMSEGLVGSTGPVEAYEIGPEGDIRWHLEVEGVPVMFRAEPVASIAGEG